MSIAPTDIIIVYVITEDLQSKKTERLFNDSAFKVKLMKIDPLPQSLSNDWRNECNRFRLCLLDAEKKHPQNSIIILKDSSVTTSISTACLFGKAINKIIKRMKETLVGITYLCKWNEKCNMATEKWKVEGTEVLVHKGIAPHGNQAFLLTASGRDYLLGKNGSNFDILSRNFDGHLNDCVVNKQLPTYVTSPNMIEFDITSSRDPEEIRLKTMECCVENVEGEEGEEVVVTDAAVGEMKCHSYFSIWLWLFFVILVALIVAWIWKTRR